MLWPDLLSLLSQLGLVNRKIGTSDSTNNDDFFEKTARSGLLPRSFHLRRLEPVKSSADRFLSAYLRRVLRCCNDNGRWSLPLKDPAAQQPVAKDLEDLVATIPPRLEDVAAWILSADDEDKDRQSPASSSKCVALVLLYHLELSQSSK